MKNVDMKKIGWTCQEFRQSIGIRQVDVADETGYDKGSISAFENGRTNNCALFLWYVAHGLTFELLKEKGVI